MATATETDVSQLVNSAFEEIECAAKASVSFPHAGRKAAYISFHGCGKPGFVCQAHYKVVLEEILPFFKRTLQRGAIICRLCDREFTAVETWVQVYPL